MQRSTCSILAPLKKVAKYNSVRSLSSKVPPEPSKGEPEASQGWLGKLFHFSDKAVGSHSATLAETHHVYEMQFHKVKPRYMDEYIKHYQTLISFIKEKKIDATLVGSWSAEIGSDQDEAVHIWSYTDYKVLHDAMENYRNDPEFMAFRKERNRMIDRRSNLVMMKFSFWSDPVPRKLFDNNSIYELRTYSLKPGNLIEWGNLWARGIKFRQYNSEAVCGWFEQVGHLYTAHHLWNYKDMRSRKETREKAWTNPGWDENVAYTVPLIRKMRSRILIPNPFSPMQ